MDDINVNGFIARFAGAQDTFLNGCCYWFAVILKERFRAAIYYHPIDNHFAGKISDKLYDVTGEIDGEGFVPWDEYKYTDLTHARRICEQCIA